MSNTKIVPETLTYRMMQAFDDVIPDYPINRMQRLWSHLISTWEKEQQENLEKQETLGLFTDEE